MPTSRKKRVVDTEWFRARLKERGMSQRELARHLRMDIATINTLIHGRRDPKIEDIENLAVKLDVAPSVVRSKFGERLPIKPKRR